MSPGTTNGHLEILDKPESFGLQCKDKYLFESDDGELMAVLWPPWDAGANRQAQRASDGVGEGGDPGWAGAVHQHTHHGDEED